MKSCQWKVQRTKQKHKYKYREIHDTQNIYHRVFHLYDVCIVVCFVLFVWLLWCVGVCSSWHTLPQQFPGNSCAYKAFLDEKFFSHCKIHNTDEFHGTLHTDKGFYAVNTEQEKFRLFDLHQKIKKLFFLCSVLMEKYFLRWLWIDRRTKKYKKKTILFIFYRKIIIF